MGGHVIKRVVVSMAGALRNCFSRFPATVGFATLLACVLSFYVAVEEVADTRLKFVAVYFLSVGTLLSLTLHLWGEEVKSRTRKAAVYAVANILLAADALMLYYFPEGKNPLETGIAHGAAVFSLFVSLFFLSFFREKDDMPGWNFAVRGLKSFIAANILGLVMFGGISLLVLSLNRLFGMEIPDKTYLYISIFCNLLLVVILFVGFLPQGAAKHDNRPVPGNILTLALRYLFLPLTAGYMALLYIYGAKILIAWELPAGWVSWLVTLLMLGCLIVEFCIYPVRKAKTGKWDEIVARWLPILILPLLLLMTAGIIRRFCDYGVTINRLYITTFNIWCYAVCAGLFLTRARRIAWIPVSFAAVFLATSVFPFNYTSITRNILQNGIETSFARAGFSALPLTGEEYRQWNAAVPQEEAMAINGKISYMEETLGRESISRLIVEEVTIDTIRTALKAEGEDRADISLYLRVPDPASISVPDGYGEFVRIDEYPRKQEQETGSGRIALPVSLFADGSSDTLTIDMGHIKPSDTGDAYLMHPLTVYSSTGQHCLVITLLNISQSSEGEICVYNIAGYLFKKQP